VGASQPSQPDLCNRPLVFEHNLYGNIREVEHINGIQLVVKTVLPIDLDVNVADVLL
jgi:hypothetical protein